MATGTVKWFSNAKGYGFVAPDGGGGDVFVHFSVIDMDGYKTLKRGQQVQFELSQGPKGLHATEVTSCPSDVVSTSAATETLE
jgi:CspA family cold shock protein